MKTLLAKQRHVDVAIDYQCRIQENSLSRMLALWVSKERCRFLERERAIRMLRKAWAVWQSRLGVLKGMTGMCVLFHMMYFDVLVHRYGRRSG